MSAEPPGPWIVTGSPDDRELAAVVAVLGAPAQPPAPGPVPDDGSAAGRRWGSPALLLHRVHPFAGTPRFRPADEETSG